MKRLVIVLVAAALLALSPASLGASQPTHIVGVFRDDTGAPIAGGLVTFQTRWASEEGSASARTDRRGQYALLLGTHQRLILKGEQWGRFSGMCSNDLSEYATDDDLTINITVVTVRHPENYAPIVGCRSITVTRIKLYDHSEIVLP